jgi:serine/threonine-protein kinase
MRGLGSEFGGYQLEQVVLTDAVSVTYRATMPRERGSWRRDASPNLSRPLLLRISDPLSDVDADDHAAVFLSRIGAVGQVSHPAVAKPIDTGYVDGRVYVATRWTAGLTLEEHIRREGRLEPEAACRLLLPIADALDTLHMAGVVHGAISPRTIWIHDAQGARSARITGFALDTSLYGHDAGGTGDGVLSEAFYVAPEQFRGAPASDAADLYALACTLYHCVGGRPPFSSAMAAVRAGALEPGPPVFDFSTDEIPDVLVGAIAIGMADRATQRYASCMALLQAAQGANGTARTMSEPEATQDPEAIREPEPVPAAAAAGADADPDASAWRKSPLTFAWPIAALLVIAGIAIALILTSIFRSNALAEAGEASPPASSVTATAERT